MGVGSSKKREQEKKEREEKEKQEKLEQAKKDLEEKIKELELKLDQLNSQAKSFKEEAKKKLEEGDKMKAKYLLSKKKKCEQQAEKLNGALMMMDDQLFTIDNAQNFGGIVQAIKNTNDVLKAEQGQVTVSRMESLTNSLKELKAQNDEVNQFLVDINKDNIEDEDIEDDFYKLENEIQEEEQKFPGSNKEKISEDKKESIKQKKLMEA